MKDLLARTAGAVLLAAMPMVAAPALASPALAPGPVIARSLPAAAPLSPTISITDFDVTGIFSNDPFGDPINEVFTINLGPNALVTGIGWDVTLFADAPSWLSEAVIAFGSTSNPFIVSLTVGIGDDFPGTEAYSSGGIVDLVGLGLDFAVDADGLLRLEFFEAFDDFADDWDGIWEAGFITIQSETADVVPAPAPWLLLASGLGLAALARRRAARA